MKKMTLLSILAIAIVLMPACNNEAGSMDNASPKEVLHDFFEKMGKKDFDGAAKLATEDSKPTLNMMKQSLAMAEQYKTGTETEKDPSENFKDVEIGEARIDGDNAYVPFKKEKDDIEIEFPLKKEDGGWKVDFSMATMMKIGFDQAKKRGVINDSTTLEDIQNKLKEGMSMKDSIMNSMDPSTKEMMKKGMKTYDSLMKAQQ